MSQQEDSSSTALSFHRLTHARRRTLRSFQTASIQLSNSISRRPASSARRLQLPLLDPQAGRNYGSASSASRRDGVTDFEDRDQMPPARLCFNSRRHDRFAPVRDHDDITGFEVRRRVLQEAEVVAGCVVETVDGHLRRVSTDSRRAGSNSNARPRALPRLAHIQKGQARFSRARPNRGVGTRPRTPGRKCLPRSGHRKTLLDRSNGIADDCVSESRRVTKGRTRKGLCSMRGRVR
jgi:hypothetical protein